MIIGVLLVGLSWGLFNRARGWGDATTKFGQWLSHQCDRWSMALCSAITLTVFLYYLNVWDLATLVITFPVIVLGWFCAVVWGVGDYLDGHTYPNKEIKWIDSLVNWLFKNKTPTARTVDNISIGLRGIYRLPLYILLGLLLQTYWMAIPVFFFWSPALVYKLVRNMKPDPQFYAEWLDFFILGSLIATACVLTYYTGY